MDGGAWSRNAAQPFQDAHTSSGTPTQPVISLALVCPYTWHLANNYCQNCKTAKLPTQIVCSWAGDKKVRQNQGLFAILYP